MNITLNNIEQASNLVTFTDIPNILMVSDTSGGTYARLTITFTGNLAAVTTLNNQWQININGDTIQNVLNAEDAVNKNFIAMVNPSSTAASVVRALRNSSSLFSTFKIQQSNNVITLTARQYGNIPITFSSNISSSYLSYSTIVGSSYSDFEQKLIDVDIISDGDYITTLEKTFTNGQAAFNISPILTTMAEKFVSKPYQLVISSYKNGDYNLLATLSNNYASIGYMVNQAERYLSLPNGIYLAQNVGRGTQSGTLNAMPLYVYERKLPLSFYAFNTAGASIRFDYLDSAYNVIGTETTQWRNSNSSQVLKNITHVLDDNFMNNAFYVDVVFGSSNPLRYNVIKPLNATEGNTRIYWINEYGGTSFIDMAGQREETRELELTTYKKNIFDYYTDDVNSLELPYDNTVKYQVTIRSHLFENDGKYIFNSLLQTPFAWTEVNGEKYALLIKSIDVDETEQNNVYRAKVVYEYSQEPSLL